jgi:raffinose/stachyose/melibiose transport system substrate-binding protein
MKRKSPILFMFLLVLALIASACGQSSGSGAAGGNADKSDKSNAGGAAPAATAKPASAEKITLKMMHLWPEASSPGQSKTVKQIVDEYQKANPNVTITMEVLENEQYKNKLKVLSASNDLPDIGFTWAAGFMEPYVNGKMFTPLNDLLQGDLKGKFVAGTTEAYSFNGNTYALPVELNIVPIYYNKAIFQKYNLQVPKTYDDLKNAIKTLNANGVIPITLGAKDAWTASFWYMYLAERIGGPELLDKSVAGNTFTDPALIDAGKKVQELVDLNAFNKGFIGLSNDEAKAAFMNGKAAMYMMGTWEIPNYTTAPDVPQTFKDQVGFFKMPTLDGGKGGVDDWVGGPGVGLFVAQKSKHIDEAKKFVSFFVQKWGEHSVSDAGMIPATKVDTSAVKLPQMYTDLLNQLGSAKKVTLFLDVQMKPKAAQEHYNLIQALFGKATTPEQFAQKQEAALKAGN